MTVSFDPGRRRVADAGFAIVVGVLMMLGTAGVSSDASRPDWLGWSLLALAAASLVVRRRWPVAVMGVAIAAGLTYTVLGNPGGFYTLAIGTAIFTVAASRRRMAAVAGLLASFGLFVGSDFLLGLGHGLSDGGALWFLGWLTVALLLGEVARNRSDYVGAVAERAAEEERSRQEQVLRRAGEERMEIARELHDVLAHSISIMNVQAGAALRHLEEDPDRSKEALTIVRDTGKRAMAELRSSIDVLRRSDVYDEAPRSPAPGLDDIHDLAARTRATGVRVEVREFGEGNVAPQVGLAAYRIVQESLTNVARHAAATTATVTIDRLPDRLVVRVDDDGRQAPADPAEGHGIDGMRERVRALDGEFEVGPLDAGGFRVEARFPLQEPA